MRVDIRAWGFFVHVIDEQTGKAHTCAVDIPGWPHIYNVLVSTASAPNAADLADVHTVEGFDGYVGFSMQGADMRLECIPPKTGLTLLRGTGIPDVNDSTSCHSLDLIVDFSEILVDASLATDWEQTPEILGRFTFSGGNVSADPDGYTSAARVWTWNGRNNQVHRQAISSFLHYRSPETEEATLVVTRRTAISETNIRIPLRASASSEIAQVVLLSTPTKPPDSTDYRGKYRLSLAHAHAAMLFANVPTGDVRWVAAPSLESTPPNPHNCAGPGRFRMFVSGETGCSAGRWHTMKLPARPPDRT